MKHAMKLKLSPFKMIQSGQKTIELRLYDEKRQRVQVGDEIEFTCTEGTEAPFTVEVKAMHVFESFASLYAALPLLKCGYTEEDVGEADPRDMDLYYSTEEQARYGVVGIEVQRK